MARKIILFISLAFALSCVAQVATDSNAQSEGERVTAVNINCRFKFTNVGLVSVQNPSKDYLVYEAPGLSASELKASTLNTITSLYNSPQDVVTSLSDNMIQFEGYISHAYYEKAGDDIYPVDFSFTWTMQFKDGKIRFNIPKIQQIYVTEVPLMGSLRLDMTKPISVLIDNDSNRLAVSNIFNLMILAITRNAKSANDW